MLGWQSSTLGGATAYLSYGTAAGKRNAFGRIPERRTTIIILTDNDGVDARALSVRIYERLSDSR
jgi:hypothetical protein